MRAIHEYLNGRGLSFEEPGLEAGRNHEGNAHIGPTERRFELCWRRELTVQGEILRGDEAIKKLAAGGRAVVVVDAEPDVLDVHVDRVSEQEQQDHRHQGAKRERSGVAIELAKLLED